MDKGTLTDLYRHMEWADAAVWSRVMASDSGRKDAPLRERLYHLHLVQRAFLREWRHEPRETPYPAFKDSGSLMAWAQSFHGEALEHIASLSAEALSAAMPLSWESLVERRMGRAPERTTLGETALQVALHSMHHRGQVSTRLRECGGEPPLIDYIAWLWEGRPAAAWPAFTVFP
jgi:uncharacterized damage-inducible protein DinB